MENSHLEMVPLACNPNEGISIDLQDLVSWLQAPWKRELMDKICGKYSLKGLGEAGQFLPVPRDRMQNSSVVPEMLVRPVFPDVQK